MDREDLHRIRQYTFRSELDKALHSLEGILKGISIDGKVNSKEIEELRLWGKRHFEFVDRHPFKELVPLVLKSVADNHLDPEEVQDILWMAKNVRTDSKYYNIITSDIQRLEGILHGILADNEINDLEVHGLSEWLFDNEQLKGSYPYDELCSLITAITADGVIDDDERKMLKLFIADFVDVKNMAAVDPNELDDLKKQITINGICALDPEITIENRLYCLTGVFGRSSRKEIVSLIEGKGGTHHDGVTKDTNYLVIGSDGNPCWAFSCYGRKVEKAVEMRKEGIPIAIVNEVDFWDAIQ
ncbi:MAG: BRCT domain-containing protein [Planctomycetes bacterium]|nr:BRCT domain-containing protein [Planctomycetota bacterium]